MLPAPRQHLRLFNAFGISVSLHWSWFVVAAIQLQRLQSSGMSLGVAVLEYLILFAIVLMHEFGHALACRQVGGEARDIILWPLGGVAFVSPPQRPGAVLWSIAAGPLVNAVLAVPLFGALSYALRHPLPPGVGQFIWDIWWMNLGLLIFNVLPIYPLDGGQILRALLWFPLGKVRSLWIASAVGVLGAAVLVGLALEKHSIWTGIIALFILSQCWTGFKEARYLRQLAAIPRHNAFSCPDCSAHPLKAALWVCGGCQQPFDPFLHHGTCPNCGHAIDAVTCPECRHAHSLETWGPGR